MSSYREETIKTECRSFITINRTRSCFPSALFFNCLSMTCVWRLSPLSVISMLVSLRRPQLFKTCFKPLRSVSFRCVTNVFGNVASCLVVIASHAKRVTFFSQTSVLVK